MYKKFIQGKKAFCFDLDGTVVNSEPLWFKAFEKVFAALDENFNTQAKTIAARPGESSFQKWAELKDKNLIKTTLNTDELTTHLANTFVNLLETANLEVIEGFWSTVYELKINRQLKLALITNTNSAVAKMILKKVEINQSFDLMLFGDNIKKPKPNPEIYLEAIKTLNLKPSEILVFEDSIAGVKASTAANLDTVVIWNAEFNKSEYPESNKILEFLPDFTGIPSNLDTTFDEGWQQYSNLVKAKFEKKMQTINENLGRKV